MQDRDHLAEEHGYINPMQLLAAAWLLQELSYPEGLITKLGLEITHEERLSATTGDATRKLALSKLQERF